MSKTPTWDGPQVRYVGKLSFHHNFDRSHLMSHLAEAFTLIHNMVPLPEDDTDGCAFAVRWDEVEHVAACYNLLHDISRAVPHVQAWVAGYWWSERRHWSGFYGCGTEEQAKEIAQAAQEKEIARYSGRKPSAWEARLTDIAVHSCVLPNAKPSDVIAGLYT